MKYLNKCQSNIPTLIDEDGIQANSGSQKVDLLNSKCFNCKNAPLGIEDNSFPLDHHSTELYCYKDQVYEILCGLDTSKSNGPDGISSRMFKSTASSIAPSIAQLFNLFICVGKVPSAWKLSFIVPFLNRPGLMTQTTTDLSFSFAFLVRCLKSVFIHSYSPTWKISNFLTASGVSDLVVLQSLLCFLPFMNGCSFWRLARTSVQYSWTIEKCLTACCMHP